MTTSNCVSKVLQMTGKRPALRAGETGLSTVCSFADRVPLYGLQRICILLFLALCHTESASAECTVKISRETLSLGRVTAAASVDTAAEDDDAGRCRRKASRAPLCASDLTVKNSCEVLPTSVGFTIEISRHVRATNPAGSPFFNLRQQTSSLNRSFIKRHPVLVGALLGFGVGFTIGIASGDDGVFNDFTAGFNGLVLGAIGAGVGASIGVAFK